MYLKLKIGSFNVRGIMPGTSYVCHIMDTYDLDIMCLCEHWLYPDSLSYLSSMHTNYLCDPKADRSLNIYDSIRRGKGGVAILWKKSINSIVSKMYIDDDRISGLCITLSSGARIFLINVYMPSSDYPIEVYRSYVQKVSDLYEEYNSIGEVVLLGDWNAEVDGENYTARDDYQSRELISMCSNLDIASLCVSYSCSGPRYTFDPFESGNNRSLIDHILIPKSISDLAESCVIVSDRPYNTSDHLPVIFQLNVEAIVVPHISIDTPRPNWRKASLMERNNYTCTLAQLLESCDYSQLSNDEYYQVLVKAANMAASFAIPHTKFNPHLKPYWYKVKVFHDDMCKLRKVWIQNGKKRGCDPHFRSFKEAKRIFRLKLRLEKEAEDRQFYEGIDESAEIDLELFWRYVKKMKKDANAKVEELEYKGQVFRRPPDIANAWADYFEDLYDHLDDPSFDQEHYIKVRSELADFLNESESNECDIMDTPVELDELVAAAVKLKTGKAGGVDGLTNEHIKYGGQCFLRHICEFFNRIHSKEDMPPAMKEGLMITLLKDYKRRHRDPNNHRGITMMPALYKFWECVMLPRLLKWKALRRIVLPDPLQFAYQERLSCIHVSFSLQECIAYLVERGAKVYLCLLDLRKAFDLVWHDGLFYIMFKLGINGKFWRILRNIYKGMTGRVMTDGIKSKKFGVKQSVRQGGVLSPWLYLIFINGLITSLREAGLGAYIGSIYCGTFLQADDIALLSLTPGELQRMINVCVDYFQKWRSSLNVRKCLILVYGESLATWKKLSQLRVWKAGDEIIKESRNATHVGVELDVNFSPSKCIEKACNKGRGALLSLAGTGVRPKGLNPLTSANLYKQAVVPCSLYGSELWSNMSKCDKHKLEIMHRFCIKVIQDLPPRTRTDMAQSLIGVPGLEEFIDRRKLIFIRQLTELPSECVAKEIFLLRLCQYKVGHISMKGCIPDLVRVLDKYQLAEYIIQYHNNATKFPSKEQWKMICDEAITANYRRCYHLRTMNDDDFKRFNIVKPEPLSPSSHWLCALRIPYSLPILTSAVKVLCQMDNKDVTLCEYCGVLHKDCVFHKSTVCPITSALRDEFFDCLIDNFSLQTNVLLNNMSEDELLNALLGACSPELDSLISDEQYCYYLYLCSLYLDSIKRFL